MSCEGCRAYELQNLAGHVLRRKLPLDWQGGLVKAFLVQADALCRELREEGCCQVASEREGWRIAPAHLLIDEERR